MFDHAQAHLHTIRDLLRLAISRFTEAGLFYGHGTDNAWDEAAYLIAHSLNLPLTHFDQFLDARLLPAETAKVLSLLQQRVEKKCPAAYLTHEAWLGEFRFYVDQRVIVPRSFIAELMPESLEPWIEYPELVHRALDLCTGSGCLAILMAHHYPDAEIDAIDLSEDALAVAQRNVKDYRLEDRITLIQSDLLSAVQDKQYDLIISNPPYVDAPSVAELPEEYLKEPEMALGSGEDGLDATRVIIESASQHLTEFGILVVEIGHNRDVLELQYPNLEFIWLETSGGDGFVFLLTRQALIEAGY